MTTNQTTINNGLDEEKIQYNLPPRQTTTTVHPVKKSSSNTSGKVIALGTLGVLAGIAGAAGISAYTRAPGMSEDKVTFPPVDGQNGDAAASSVAGTSAAETASGAHDAPVSDTTEPAGTPAEHPDLTPDQQDNLQSYGSAIYLPETFDEVGVAFTPDDSMSFAQAFSTARAEVGPHGIFAWHGGVFGTYYADEWNSLPVEYRESFSNHDWSNTGDVTFVVEDVPAAPYDVATDADGRVYVMLVEAVTGDSVAYYPDGNLTPVIDNQGQLLAMVDTELVENAGVNAIVIDFDGNVTLTDDAAAVLADAVAADQAVLPEEGVPSGDYDPESDVVEVITADDEEAYVPEVIDDDAVVLDLDDEDYDVVEVLDDDDYVSTVTDSVDANETFDDLPGDDMAASDIEEFSI